MGNDYITDLITRDRRGEDIQERARALQHRLPAAVRRVPARLYDGQYPLMGNAQVMTAKVAWDNACYWAITALLFFQRRLAQPEFMATIDPLMRRFFVLHARMQRVLPRLGPASMPAQLRRGLHQRRGGRVSCGACRRASADRR